MNHIGVTCNGCGISDFAGNRFKCTVCNDFDYCDECQRQGAVTDDHDADHPMTLIPPGGNSISFGGAPSNCKFAHYCSLRLFCYFVIFEFCCANSTTTTSTIHSERFTTTNDGAISIFGYRSTTNRRWHR